MAKGNSGLASRVIVVGEPDSELVHMTVRLARDGEFAAVLCDNIYSAVAELAKATGQRLLVVGPIQDLAGENGIFFRLALARAARCCCLLDQSRPVGRADLLAALRAGATMVGDAREVGSVLAGWLTRASFLGPRHGPLAGDEGPTPRRRPDAERPLGLGAGSDEWRATEAELNALLG